MSAEQHQKHETALFSVFFLPDLITRSVCFGEEEISADNQAPGKNHLNNKHSFVTILIEMKTHRIESHY